MQIQALQSCITDSLENSKALNIVTLDVSQQSSITDRMIICTGTSSRHVMSIADNLVNAGRNAGLVISGIKRLAESDWLIVDLGDAIVHILQEESRQLYALEKLWG